MKSSTVEKTFKLKVSKGMGVAIGNIIRQSIFKGLPTWRPIAFKIGDQTNAENIVGLDTPYSTSDVYKVLMNSAFEIEMPGDEENQPNILIWNNSNWSSDIVETENSWVKVKLSDLSNLSKESLSDGAKLRLISEDETLVSVKSLDFSLTIIFMKCTGSMDMEESLKQVKNYLSSLEGNYDTKILNPSNYSYMNTLYRGVKNVFHKVNPIIGSAHEEELEITITMYAKSHDYYNVDLEKILVKQKEELENAFNEMLSSLTGKTYVNTKPINDVSLDDIDTFELGSMVDGSNGIDIG